MYYRRPGLYTYMYFFVLLVRVPAVVVPSAPAIQRNFSNQDTLGLASLRCSEFWGGGGGGGGGVMYTSWVFGTAKRVLFIKVFLHVFEGCPS